MLESHHIISSLISPVTISRSRQWPRVQLSFEQLGLWYYEVNYFSKTGDVSASDGIDNCAQTFTSLEPTDLRWTRHLRCHDRWWYNTLHLRHKICSDSLQGASLGVTPPPFKTFCVVACSFVRGRYFHNRKRPIWIVKSCSGRSLAFISVQLVASNINLRFSNEWKAFLSPLCRVFWQWKRSSKALDFCACGQVSQKVQCFKCDRAFSRKDNLKAHVESVHLEGVSKFSFACFFIG